MNEDVSDVYLVPVRLRDEGFDALVCQARPRRRRAELGEWDALVERIGEREGSIEIALVGKYVKLQDAYLSVHEALKHSGIHHGVNVRVRWVDAEGMSVEEAARSSSASDGVLVPGGFGSRGWEGKIVACRVAREAGIPYLGICLGMHVAISEFARHVAGLEGANSTEMDPETPYPVIDLLPEQKEIEDLGGTMRLGAQPVDLDRGTRAHATYGGGGRLRAPPAPLRGEQPLRPGLLEAGLVVSGTYQEGRLVEIIELPDHPWFVASQFHPEFKSRPTRPAPLFRDFVGAPHGRASNAAGCGPEHHSSRAGASAWESTLEARTLGRASTCPRARRFSHPIRWSRSPSAARYGLREFNRPSARGGAISRDSRFAGMTIGPPGVAPDVSVRAFRGRGCGTGAIFLHRVSALPREEPTTPERAS